MAPPLAAQREGRQVDWSVMLAAARAWRDQCELLIVEGAGGLLCPVTETELLVAFAAELGHPLVIVAANRLGVVNHTLLTLQVAERNSLPVAAVVLNDISAESDRSAANNSELIARFAPDVPLLRLMWGQSTFVTREGSWTGLDWRRASLIGSRHTGQVRLRQS
ncbi:MAG: dethiobiotin synthase [Planctomycetaceae bacterium]